VPFRRLLSTLALLLASATVNADSLVLIHGYMSSAQTWHRSGIVSILRQNGWPLAGHFGPRGFQPFPHVEANGNRVYTVDIPWAHPIEFQADVLNGFLRQIAALHPAEKIILAGHSAGGIAGRAALIRDPIPQINALITIASPHVGTPLAAKALKKTSGSGPFGVVKGLFGGNLYHTVRRSRGVLVDLLPPSRRNLLGWLNQQPHPAIHYFSVVRSNGDRVVPPFSGDMNQVPVLAGRSYLILSNSSHELSPTDGVIILDILRQLALLNGETGLQQALTGPT